RAGTAAPPAAPADPVSIARSAHRSRGPVIASSGGSPHVEMADVFARSVLAVESDRFIVADIGLYEYAMRADPVRQIAQCADQRRGNALPPEWLCHVEIVDVDLASLPFEFWPRVSAKPAQYLTGLGPADKHDKL